MDASTILFVVEQVIFWIFVVLIAWFGKSAPRWLFTAFSIYLTYYIFRVAFGMRGWPRFTMVYLLALVIVFIIWYYMV